MTQNMAEEVNMPQNHQNGFGETPGEERQEEEIEEEIPIEEEENVEELVENASNEYQDLSNTLDQIDRWMTDIETQNDSLVSKLRDLLESNRQIRAELQQENSEKKTS
ncbi:UPF0184 protein-like [Ostrea edulis]|uniref:UPF0184 protein-like n=1 Tax=Ostrea edulis TaxID=37623 RepID=UPI002094EA41|nr:UPF0184 protein-like [Ostrea edulis]